jgi:hypothetical protein
MAKGNQGGGNGDPLVRSDDPFARKHIQTPDEETEGINQSGGVGSAGGNVAGKRSPETGDDGRHPVEAEPDSDMDLEGFDKK